MSSSSIDGAMLQKLLPLYYSTSLFGALVSNTSLALNRFSSIEFEDSLGLYAFKISSNSFGSSAMLLSPCYCNLLSASSSYSKASISSLVILFVLNTSSNLNSSSKPKLSAFIGQICLFSTSFAFYKNSETNLSHPQHLSSLDLMSKCVSDPLTSRFDIFIISP